MKKPRFSLATYKDPETVEIIRGTDPKVLAVWAIDCATRTMPYFEVSYLDDHRPRLALVALKTWIDTDVFNMQVIRKASLNAHAAAKEIGNNSSAASVAHSAGQAVATAHVPMHALGAANYALQAIYRATEAEKVVSAINNERNWQLKHLQDLKSSISLNKMQ